VGPSDRWRAAGFRYRDGDRLGIDWGVVRHVILVAQKKLELMRAEWKRDLRLSLPRAEVQVVEVIRNRLIEWRCGASISK
jgi:hypothetical protein